MFEIKILLLLESGHEFHLYKKSPHLKTPAIPIVFFPLFLSTIERVDAASKLGQPADYPG